MINRSQHQLNSKLETVPIEPIAIVGIGCRFPGGVQDPKSFWDLLSRGIDAITDTPKNRWDIRRFYDENPKKPGKMYSKQAGYLNEDHEYFDPLFFGISPREAECLDPQQRLLLEVVWEGLEDAGFDIEKLKGSDIGVFMGGFCLDSMLTHFNSHNRHLVSANTSTGTAMAILANRISYVFDFCGPSVAIDTACSSSLVACHFACQSLWNKESSVAIAGGVNVMTRPELPIIMSKGQFLSKHCRCMTFDERADGYTRGEGAGVVILKPLKRAVADNDRIYALIKASGINQDGHTTSMTLPSRVSQAKLIRQVYRLAGVSPNEVQYVEAHGTGTKAGDSTEAFALDSVLSKGRSLAEKCFVGSVKTNIGHLEAAAGIAGLIKTALSLKNSKIPPNLHFQNPSPEIPFEKLHIKVPNNLENLAQSNGKPVYAGVNSFGYGGTNAHILLEAVLNSKNIPAEVSSESENFYRLVPLSARSELALVELARVYLQFISQGDGADMDFETLVYALALRRTHHPYRLALVVKTKQELVEKLGLFSHSSSATGMVVGKAFESIPSSTFIFTGMGPQHWGMGQQLLNSEPVFRESLKSSDKLFSDISGFSILSELLKNQKESKLNEVAISQPVSFAIQIALTELWKSWGITPAAVVGHSVGEVAAAYIAGILSLEDAFKITFHRSQFQQALEERGSLLAITATKSECEAFLNGNNQVAIAAINSPNSITLTGSEKEIGETARSLAENQIFTQRLRVDLAYHSCQMDSFESKLRKVLKTIKPNRSGLPIYSTVTGRRLDDDLMDAEYWWKNIRQPVLFKQAMESVIQDGFQHFLEVGPHPVLGSYIKENLYTAGMTGETFYSLHRSQPEQFCMLSSLANQFVKGFSVNWGSITPQSRYTKSLPTYPWQKERHWLESKASRQDRLGQPGHVFINEDKYMPIPTWEVELNTLFFPYLTHHCINDSVVFPAAGYVEAGLAIHNHLFDDEICLLEDIRFLNLLVYDSDSVQKVQSIFDPQKNSYAIYSKKVSEDSEWSLHAAARMMPNPGIQSRKFHKTPGDLQSSCPIEIEELYRTYNQLGLNYGKWFQAIKQLWHNGDEALAKVQLPSSLDANDIHNLFHPVLLDACFQTLIAPLFSRTLEGNYLFVPCSIERLTFLKRPKEGIWCYTKIIRHYEDEVYGNISVFDSDHDIIAELTGVSLKRLGNQESKDRNLLNAATYELKWEQKSDIKIEPSSKAEGDWLVFDTSKRWWDSLVRNDAFCQVKPVRIHTGSTFTQKSLNMVSMSPTNPDHMNRLFKVYRNKRFISILYLWNLEESNVNDETIEAVDRCVPLLHLAQELSGHQHSVNIVIVTYKAQAVQKGDLLVGLPNASIWGLARVIGNEHPNIHCKVIDLDSLMESDVLDVLSKEIASPNGDNEIAIRKGIRWVNRLSRMNWSTHGGMNEKELVDLSTKNTVTLDLERAGNLDTLCFREVPRHPPGPNEVEIEIHSTALNFKDLLKCFGRLPRLITENTYIGDARGMEGAGTITRKGVSVKNFNVGDHVVAAFPGAFSSYANVGADFVMHKPKSLRFEDAPIMIGFVTACYCLTEVVRLQRGEKILIHNASGGVGLAAVQVAQHGGAEIFATAGSEEKRRYLNSIGIQHTYNSRTLEFADQIRNDTRDHGVDVIIGAVSGNALQRSFSLLAPYGRYLEIGKKDIAENNSLGMRQFNENVSFFGIDIDRILVDRPQIVKRLFSEITQGFEEGYYHSIPVKVFPASEVDKAFHFMAKSHHIGKIVVRIKDQQVPVRKKIGINGHLNRNATYLIAGGTSGLGLAISQWLSEQHVKQIVLIGRNGATQETRDAINSMQKNGTKIHRASVDVTNEGQLADLFDEMKTSMPPLKGVFHCAAVIDDGLLVKLNKSRFSTVMAPKVRGAMLLHRYSKELELDFLVSSSSISSLIGNPGQANYAAANAFLDAFSHFSRTHGLPAITINWGIFSEQGTVARNGELKRLLQDMGIRPFNNREIFHILEAVLSKKPTQVGAFSIDWRKWASLSAKNPNSSLFADLIQHADNNVSENQKKLLKKLKHLNPEQQNEYLVCELKQQVGDVLRFPTDKIDVNCSIEKMGIDSLMAAELRLIILKEFGVEFSTALLLQNITISQICENILTDLNGKITSTIGPSTTDNDPATKGALETAISHSSEQPTNGKQTLSEEASETNEVSKVADSFKRYTPYLNLRQRMEDLRQQAAECGIVNLESPYFRVHEGISNHITRIQGQECINFSSYNYLGLSGHPEVSEAAQQAITEYGTSVSASRMVSGERPIHQQLENEIAGMLGTEAALVFVSGHATNVTALGHLFDADDLIVYDSFIHDSVIQGSILSGARRMSFPHNDLHALDDLLRKYRGEYNRLLIVIEGIYSMDGDIPDLPRFIEIKKRHGGYLMVDEAHSLGVLGDHGFGIGEYYKIDPQDVDIWMGTLSKSLASCGGYISGCKELIEYLKYTTPGFRYSVGISPANAAAALAAVRLLKNEPERVRWLQDRAALFSDLALEKSIGLVHSEYSPILPIIIGSSNRTLKLAHQLFSHNINVQPILYPAVSENAARLRFFVTALHTEEQIRYTADTLAKMIECL